MESSKKCNKQILGLLQTSPLISYLHPPIIHSILSENDSNFLTQISRIVKLKKSKFRQSQIKVVSQNLKTVFNLPEILCIHELFDKKKTTRTKELFKLIIPNSNFRMQIEYLRLEIIENLRKNQEISEDKLRKILELYFILNMEKHDIAEEMKKLTDKKQLSEIKKIAISLKKMIGSSLQLQEEEKQVKRKAYQHNIEVRQILSYCGNLIKQDEVKIKFQRVLSAPKNKKWFGSMFYKLLVKDNWTKDEIILLTQHMKKFLKSPDASIKKVVRNTRTTLNQSLRKMQKLIQSMDKQGSEFTNCFEKNEDLEEDKVEENIKEQLQIESLLNLNEETKREMERIHYSSIQGIQLGIDFLEERQIW